MSLFAEDAYTEPTTIFRSLSQLLLQTREEEDGGGRGRTWWGRSCRVREDTSPWMLVFPGRWLSSSWSPTGAALGSCLQACLLRVPFISEQRWGFSPNLPDLFAPGTSRAIAGPGVLVMIFCTPTVAVWHQAGLRAGPGSKAEAPHGSTRLRPCPQTPLLLRRHRRCLSTLVEPVLTLHRAKRLLSGGDLPAQVTLLPKATTASCMHAHAHAEEKMEIKRKSSIAFCR